MKFDCKFFLYSYTILLVIAVLNNPNSTQNSVSNYHRFTAKQFRSMKVNGNHPLPEYDVMLTENTPKKSITIYQSIRSHITEDCTLSLCANYNCDVRSRYFAIVEGCQFNPRSGVLEKLIL